MAIKIRDGGAWVDVGGGGSGSGSGPIGSIIYYPSSSPPDGYLKANGASLDTLIYSDLFSIFGYTFGGSGSSFNLPDLRGEFLRGWDDSRGVDSGRTIGSSQSDSTALPNNPFGTSNPGNHSHGYNGGSLKSLQGDNAGNDDYAGGGGTTGGAGSHTHTINGGDPETRPRNVALLVCIKYQ